MNTNNKEAIKAFWDDLDKLTFLHDWSLKEKSDIVQLFKAYSTVLQDNEDAEVQETPRCGDINCNSTHCVKPSSKVEKLKELQGRFSTNLDYGAQWADLVKILNVLIEDEE